MVMLISLSLIIPFVCLTTNFILSSSYNSSREKPSPFECGFDPPITARLPFSLRFFLTTVIFLIFDVEITLILPSPLLFSDVSNLQIIYVTSFFVVILLGGLFYEWKNGALEWKL